MPKIIPIFTSMFWTENFSRTVSLNSSIKVSGDTVFLVDLFIAKLMNLGLFLGILIVQRGLKLY